MTPKQTDTPLSGEVKRGGDRSRITPALRTVLAYIYATGHMPKKIHSRTYCDALDYTTRSDYGRTRRFYDLAPEAVALIRDHPLAKAHDYLTDRGFKVDRQWIVKNTSHYVSYRRFAEPHDDEATAYRKSGLTICPGGRYRDRVRMTEAEVASALRVGGLS